MVGPRLLQIAAVSSGLLTFAGGCAGHDQTTDGSPARATPVAGIFARASAPKPAPRCTRKVSSASRARKAVAAARAGATICLASGKYGVVDLTNIDKPIRNRVTFRGMGKRRTEIAGLHWAGSSGLIVENLRSTGDVDGAQQYPAHHLTFRYMDVSSRNSAFRGVGSWPGPGQHHIVIERNFIHDAGEYGIAAQGNTPDWTVRKNRIVRIREDYIQSGDPTGWVIDNNVMGPGDFKRPSGYSGHPDVWQALESGDHLRFTNNLVRDTNQSLGFIFGAITDYSGFDHVVVRNNVFDRVVYGVGETCQFSPGNGYVFEQNTLVRAGGCRWGAGEGDPWPNGRNYSIKRNILSSGSFLSCNNTGRSNSCSAFKAGTARNVHGFNRWANRCFFKPRGLPRKIGARLSSRKFRGYPFGSTCGARKSSGEALELIVGVFDSTTGSP